MGNKTHFEFVLMLHLIYFFKKILYCVISLINHTLRGVPHVAHTIKYYVKFKILLKTMFIVLFFQNKHTYVEKTVIGAHI